MHIAEQNFQAKRRDDGRYELTLVIPNVEDMKATNGGQLVLLTLCDENEKIDVQINVHESPKLFVTPE